MLCEKKNFPNGDDLATLKCVVMCDFTQFQFVFWFS